MYLLKVIGINTCVKLGDKLKIEGVSSKEFVVTCEQCWKTFYFSRDYAKHLPCYVRHSKLKLDDQPRIL
jgi:hypothetical protein